MSRTSVFVLAAFALGLILRASPHAQTGLPLLHQGSLTYLGGFRLPDTCGGPGDFGNAYGPIAFSPTGNSGSGSIYIGSPNLTVAEVTIPPLVNSDTLANLNPAGCLQPFSEPTEGAKAQGNVGSDEEGFAEPSGMVVANGRLWINNGVGYDANGSQTLYTLSRPLNLSMTGQVHGLYGLTSSQPGFIPTMAAKSIAEISSDWSSVFGGDLFLSKYGQSIVTTTSRGPDAIVTDSSIAGVAGTVYTALTPLFYDGDHSPAGLCNQDPPPGPSTNPPGVVTNGVIQCTGPGGGASNFPGATRGSTYSWWSTVHKDMSLVQPRGTRTLLSFQVAGATKGPSEGGYGYGYGCGCSDPATTPGGSTCWGVPIDPATCSVEEGFWYDPEVGDKGEHGYPYFYQVVAYDMNTLVDVKNGILQP
jgi:hypothetical protein